MKKLIFFCAVLLCIVGYSQNTVRVYYQLESKPNLLPETPADIDVYILEINTKTNTSKFFNATYLSLDSINAKLLEESKIVGGVSVDFSKMKYPKYNIGVVDDGKQYEIYRIFDGDIYKYPEVKNTQWKIGEETQNIGSYSARKATAKVNGRDWEVYFTSDIPLSYGPYILGQLPGLVLAAHDRTNSYVFKMIGLENNVADNDYLPGVFKRAISVTKAKYQKAFENHKKDPARKLRQGIITQPDGDYITLANLLSDDYIRRKEAEWIQYYKENDNDIDKSK
ncbi:GLPGLI family protein [Riemerella columbina]|uniref:GLPGLI family protein n=1 Tax=Riemerella columbina TaxID=103810 RepID=UPI00266FA694|nr:GLPGLI family protein [Riemerella columbina]WKS94702.1 GLPGLI family protein [Riemerella columbina]